MPDAITIAYIHHGIDMSAFCVSKFGDGRGICSISLCCILSFTTFDISLGGGFSAFDILSTASPAVSTAVIGASAEHPVNTKHKNIIRIILFLLYSLSYQQNPIQTILFVDYGLTDLYGDCCGNFLKLLESANL